MSARLTGVHAATVCPMRTDCSIDEAALAAHVRAWRGRRGSRGC